MAGLRLLLKLQRKCCQVLGFELPRLEVRHAWGREVIRRLGRVDRVTISVNVRQSLGIMLVPAGHIALATERDTLRILPWPSATLRTSCTEQLVHVVVTVDGNTNCQQILMRLVKYAHTGRDVIGRNAP